jgi:hypothetical protein
MRQPGLRGYLPRRIAGFFAEDMLSGEKYEPIVGDGVFQLFEAEAGIEEPLQQAPARLAGSLLEPFEEPLGLEVRSPLLLVSHSLLLLPLRRGAPA